MREKRTEKLQTHVGPSLRHQLELFVSQSNVKSISDYLHEVIEEHIAIRSAMRISHQRIGKSVGNQ